MTPLESYKFIIFDLSTGEITDPLEKSDEKECNFDEEPYCPHVTWENNTLFVKNNSAPCEHFPTHYQTGDVYKLLKSDV